MKTKDSFRGNTNSKWMEGLVLLIVIAVIILITIYAGTSYKTIVDQNIALWSGSSIDNLEAVDKEISWEE